jgi:hypothetical protein
VERGPVIGIWYYVYVDGAWRLETFRPDEYEGVALDHPTVWKKYLVPLLKKTYKLSAAATGRLKALAYGVPRGRLDMTGTELLKPGEKPGDWVFYHGDDFPSGLVLESERRKLITAFGLSRLAAKAPEKVRFEKAKHETMVPEEREELQKVLGVRIPY